MKDIWEIISGYWSNIIHWHSSSNFVEIVGVWAAILTILTTAFIMVKHFKAQIYAMLSQLYRWLQSILQKKEENPFQCGGTLPPNVPSYIQRQCDTELEEALKTKKLIAIISDFELGKSSLGGQIKNLVPKHWNIYFWDFQGMCIEENAEAFMRDFFRDYINDIFEGVQNWNKLAQHLKKQSNVTVFCFDEFGALYEQPNIAKLFITKFHWLQETVGDQIRIVVCFPKKPANLFPSGEVREKFLCWKEISVKAFNKREIEKMLKLFPKATSKIALNHIDKITELSAGKPLALQRLGDHLFNKTQQRKLSRMEIITIITDPNSYQWRG